MANEFEKPRARGCAVAIDGRTARQFGSQLGEFLSATREALSRAFQAEAETARIAPWLPVCFGVGIIFYFAAPAEPSLIAASISTAILVLSAFLSRKRPVAFVFALGLAAIAAGSHCAYTL